jgi:hypothetical protein
MDSKQVWQGRLVAFFLGCACVVGLMACLRALGPVRSGAVLAEPPPDKKDKSEDHLKAVAKEGLLRHVAGLARRIEDLEKEARKKEAAALRKDIVKLQEENGILGKKLVSTEDLLKAEATERKKDIKRVEDLIRKQGEDLALLTSFAKDARMKVHIKGLYKCEEIEFDLKDLGEDGTYSVAAVVYDEGGTVTALTCLIHRKGKVNRALFVSKAQEVGTVDIILVEDKKGLVTKIKFAYQVKRYVRVGSIRLLPHSP